MRITLGKAIEKQMKKNDKVWFLTGDLGFGYFDQLRDHPRYLNCGCAEQNMIGVACGLASQGQVPFVYSITPFLIDRCFEIVKINVDFDGANVKLIGGGLGDDYKELGFTHFAYKSIKLVGALDSVREYYPINKKEIRKIIKTEVKKKGPCFIGVKR